MNQGPLGPPGPHLGVDFGTSSTVAMLAHPDGRVRPLLFDGSPLLPSAVCIEPGVGLLVGRDAEHAGRGHPERLERYPKRCIDDGAVLLGEWQVPTGDLISAVLHRVASEAARVAGGPVPAVVLTCPAGWGSQRRAVLQAAAAAAFPRADLVAEPVAAASYFLTVALPSLPVGSHTLVYDLGAGTFDASVVRRTPTGFDVVASDGLPDVGGLLIDAAIVGSLAGVYTARDPARWQRLVRPATPADRQASRSLWDDVRSGKEILSRTPGTRIRLPLFDDEAPLGREQLDELARPILERTVACCRQVVGGNSLSAVVLVGGASRMPLVATLLHREFRLAPTVVEQPELVVAEGALYAPVSRPASPQPVSPQPGPRPVSPPPSPQFPPPQAAPPLPVPPAGGQVGAGLSRRTLLRFGVPGVVLTAGVVTGGILLADRLRAGAHHGSTGGTSSPGPAPSKLTRLDSVSLATAGTIVNAVAFARSSHALAATSMDGVVRRWTDPSADRTPTERTAHKERTYAAFGGSDLITAGGDETVKLWRAAEASGSQPQTLARGYSVTAMAASPDGRTVAVADAESKTVRLIATADGAETGEIRRGSEELCWGLAFGPDGKCLAVDGGDGTVELWAIPGGSRIGKLRAAPDGGVAVAFPDSKALVTAGIDGSVRLWNAASLAAIADLNRAGEDSSDPNVAVSPDGRLLASGSDRALRLWHVPSRTLLYQSGEGATTSVSCVAFDSGGNWLATGGRDGGVLLWEVAAAHTG